VTPIAGSLFEACADLRLAHASASSDDAEALHTANALLQQVLAVVALRSGLLRAIHTSEQGIYTYEGCQGCEMSFQKEHSKNSIGNLFWTLMLFHLYGRRRKAAGKPWNRRSCCQISWKG
jgi:hypothetical protein